MPLVTSKEMFEKAYKGGYAIGAFNVNNMEMIQAIVEAANECRSPVILQVSAGGKKVRQPRVPEAPCGCGCGNDGYPHRHAP